jgi:hypothetical protein
MLRLSIETRRVGGFVETDEESVCLAGSDNHRSGTSRMCG